MSEWISVKDRLPEDTGAVLTWGLKIGYMIDWYCVNDVAGREVADQQASEYGD